MKNYYSCIDIGYVKHVPQPIQHLAMSKKAGDLGGKIIFYTGEDFKSLASQAVIKDKVQTRPDNVDGVIFFTLKQFFYSGKLNFSFLKLLLEKGYEVHFARENISFKSLEDLEAAFPMLYSTQYVYKRDEPRTYWKPVWDKLADVNHS